MPDRVVTASGTLTGAMANTDVLPGTWIDVRGKKAGSFQMKWSGTPTGVFSFQVCNSRNPAAADALIATLVSPAAFAAQQPAGAFPTEPIGAATGGKGYFTFADLGTQWIRAIYKNTSGTGAMTGSDAVFC